MIRCNTVLDVRATGPGWYQITGITTQDVPDEKVDYYIDSTPERPDCTGTLPRSLRPLRDGLLMIGALFIGVRQDDSGRYLILDVSVGKAGGTTWHIARLEAALSAAFGTIVDLRQAQ